MFNKKLTLSSFIIVILLSMIVVLFGIVYTSIDNPFSDPVLKEQVHKNKEQIQIKRLPCPSGFNKDQIAILKTAYDIGAELGYPETLQAIVLVESTAGEGGVIGNVGAPVGKRAYGLMQLKTVAARYVFNEYPVVLQRYFPDRRLRSILDEEIIALLISNNEANIDIGAHNLRLMMRDTKSWDDAVTAYYTGLEGLRLGNDSNHYLEKIKQTITYQVRPLNSCRS